MNKGEFLEEQNCITLYSVNMWTSKQSLIKICRNCHKLSPDCSLYCRHKQNSYSTVHCEAYPASVQNKHNICQSNRDKKSLRNVNSAAAVTLLRC